MTQKILTQKKPLKIMRKTWSWQYSEREQMWDEIEIQQIFSNYFT